MRSAASARALLADPQEVRVLHGDIHHENILDFGERGWLAIDPKGLIGERGFDYANIFTNPDLSDPTLPVATLPERFQQRLAIVTEQSGIEHRRLLHWIIAWCGLSAVGSLKMDCHRKLISALRSWPLPSSIGEETELRYFCIRQGTREV